MQAGIDDADPCHVLRDGPELLCTPLGVGQSHVAKSGHGTKQGQNEYKAGANAGANLEIGSKARQKFHELNPSWMICRTVMRKHSADMVANLMLGSLDAKWSATHRPLDAAGYRN